MSTWEHPLQSSSLLSDNSSPLVVLGGLSSYDESKQRIHFSEAADRLLQALSLHKHDSVRPLIISGGSAEVYFDERPEADYLKDYLLAIGLDSTKIHFENTSRNTYENARNTALLFDSLHLNREIILITSAFHMRRARACFNKQGFTVHAYSAHQLSQHQKLKPADYFMPSLHTLQLWPILIKEWIGIGIYRIKGYI